MTSIYSKNNSSSTFYILIAVASLFILITYKSYLVLHSKKSVVLKKPLPEFHLPALFDSTTQLTNRSLTGRVFLLNIWASWCGACRAEHNTLLMIANQYHVPIYGIAYKDNSKNAKDWLETAGNPFVITAVDSTGSLGYALGLYGTPATFIVDKQGMIRYQYLGVLTLDDWNTVLRPLVDQYKVEDVL